MKKFKVYARNNRVHDTKELIGTIEGASKREATNEAASKWQGKMGIFGRDVTLA